MHWLLWPLLFHFEQVNHFSREKEATNIALSFIRCVIVYAFDVSQSIELRCVLFQNGLKRSTRTVMIKSKPGK